MKKVLFALSLLFCSAAFGQGGYFQGPKIESQSTSVMPIPGLTITACLLAATGTPCTPTVSVFSDQGLTIPITNLQTDGDGYFAFWIAPGTYQWCASDPNQGRIQPYCNPFSVGAINGSSPSFVTPVITGSIKFTETTAPGCLVGFDFLFGDSTAHRLKQCDNNGSPVQIVNAGVDINTSDQVTGTNGATLPLSATVLATNASRQVIAATVQGNGSKAQLSTGATVNGDFVSYDANGNAVDSAKTVPAGAVVGTTDTQALSNKTLDTAAPNTLKINGATINGIPSVMQFSCTGTASAGTTLSLSGGPCTNTAGLLFPISSAATFANLRCKSQTGGVGAGSGVVTVRKNGGASTITCTFGTGTTCTDTTHSFSGAAADTVDLVFTTAGGETLANIGCTVEKQ